MSSGFHVAGMSCKTRKATPGTDADTRSPGTRASAVVVRKTRRVQFMTVGGSCGGRVGPGRDTRGVWVAGPRTSDRSVGA